MANSNFGSKKPIENAVWAALLSSNFCMKIDWFSQYGTTKSIENDDSICYLSIAGAKNAHAMKCEKTCYDGGDRPAGIAPSNSKSASKADGFDDLELAYKDAKNKLLITARSNTFGIEYMSVSVIIGGVTRLIYDDADCYDAQDIKSAQREFDMPSRILEVLENTEFKSIASYFRGGYFG
jgi:hypothetical protein